MSADATLPASDGHPHYRSTMVVVCVATVLAVVLVASGHRSVAAALLGLLALVFASKRLLSWPVLLGAVLLTIMLIPASLYALPSVVPFNLEVYRVAIILFFLVWFVALLVDPATKLRRTPLDFPMTLFSIAIILSFLTNLADFEPNLEFAEGLKAVIYVLTFVILFYAIVSVVRGADMAEKALKDVVVVASGLGIAAIFERVTTYNPFRYLDVVIPILVPAYNVETGLGDFRGGMRVSGSTPHPIAFGTMMGMVLPFALQLFFEADKPRDRAIWGACSGLIMVGMLLSVSRTAAVSLFFTFVVLAVFRKRERALLATGAVLMAIALHLFFPGLIGQFTEAFDPSRILRTEIGNREGRLEDYPRVMAEVSKNPLFGRGVGTFTPQRFFFVDNQYLVDMAEIGLFGIGATLFLFTATVTSLFRRGSRCGGRRGALIIAGGASALTYMVTTATYDALGYPQVTAMFFVLSALAVALALGATYEGHAAGDLSV